MTTRFWLGLLGVLFLAGGVLTLIHPFPASLTITLFAGWVFLVLGILQIVAAFRDVAGNARLWMGLLGLTMALIGIELLADPMAGLVALTVIVAIGFILSGFVKLFIGRSIAEAHLGWGVLLSGAVSALLGIMVLAGIPQSAEVLLGVMLAVELISTGVAALFLAASLR